VTIWLQNSVTRKYANTPVAAVTVRRVTVETNTPTAAMALASNRVTTSVPRKGSRPNVPCSTGPIPFIEWSGSPATMCPTMATPSIPSHSLRGPV
jgi:hypothetical protein